MHQNNVTATVSPFLGEPQHVESNWAEKKKKSSFLYTQVNWQHLYFHAIFKKVKTECLHAWDPPQFHPPPPRFSAGYLLLNPFEQKPFTQSSTSICKI